MHKCKCIIRSKIIQTNRNWSVDSLASESGWTSWWQRQRKKIKWVIWNLWCQAGRQAERQAGRRVLNSFLFFNISPIYRSAWHRICKYYVVNAIRINLNKFSIEFELKKKRTEWKNAQQQHNWLRNECTSNQLCAIDRRTCLFVEKFCNALS